MDCDRNSFHAGRHLRTLQTTQHCKSRKSMDSLGEVEVVATNFAEDTYAHDTKDVVDINDADWDTIEADAN